MAAAYGSLFNFSKSGWGKIGAHLLHISFATTRLHGICNGSKIGVEDEGGGGEGLPLQPHSLGTGDKCPPRTHPKFWSFVWDREGAQKCLSSATRLQEI